LKFKQTLIFTPTPTVNIYLNSIFFPYSIVTIASYQLAEVGFQLVEAEDQLAKAEDQLT